MVVANHPQHKGKLERLVEQGSYEPRVSSQMLQYRAALNLFYPH